MTETRNYFVPRNCVGRHVMNTIVNKIPCSIGDFRLKRESDTIQFTITCDAKDFVKVERILKRYDMLGE